MPSEEQPEIFRVAVDLEWLIIGKGKPSNTKIRGTNTENYLLRSGIPLRFSFDPLKDAFF